MYGTSSLNLKSINMYNYLLRNSLQRSDVKYFPDRFTYSIKTLALCHFVIRDLSAFAKSYVIITNYIY